MNLEDLLEEEKANILDKIKNANFPNGHPFIDSRFEGDYYHLILSFFLKFSNAELIIDDLIYRKISGKVNGVYNHNRFQEGIGEFNVLYYLFCGFLMKLENNDIYLKGIYYEPPAFVEGKTLEYSLDYYAWECHSLIAVEVKTIETAPEFREDINIEVGKKYVKPYFNNVSLDHLSTRDDFDELLYLQSSTHYRQLSKNIKKINQKFTSIPAVINLGVVVFQYATSMDELFAYLFHPENGIYIKNPEHFENLDALVFFSLTSTPDIMMNDLYDKNHVLTMCLTNEDWKVYMLEYLRLDNYIYKNGSIEDWVIPFVNKEYGVFEYHLSNGLMFFVNENENENLINKQAKIVSEKIKKSEQAYIQPGQK